MTIILVFGDSIAYGAWDRESGFAGRLRNWLDGRSLDKHSNTEGPVDYFLTYNLGISGETSTDLVKRFEQEAKRRIEEGEETIIIFSFCGNDAMLVNGKESVSFKKFQKNVQIIIKNAKKLSQKIIFLSEIPVDELKVNPIPWFQKGSCKNDVIQKYEIEIEKQCAQEKIYYLTTKHLFQNNQTLLEDGMHPTTEGHKKIFELLKEFLIKKEIL